MYLIQSVGITYGDKPDIINNIGDGETVNECFEHLRKRLLQSNQYRLDRAEELQIPDCIVRLAKRNIRKNPHLQFELRECDGEKGMVFIDGQCPEMDYYRVVEVI